ncbi:keratin, type I cytoskeletal 13-like [Brachyhypopomus gauderio]|uniref:keratin, type I cytoskeletal 13-like n=1 Tax=Brachyhypopomus gauderio TaxID=698409 RepID=UPI004042F610
MALIATHYSHSTKAPSFSVGGSWGSRCLFTTSIYGAARSSGSRIPRGPALIGTSAANQGLSFDFGFQGMGDVINVFENKKTTMQILNDRLAVYLEKVHLLEKANAELELKIRKFLDGKSSLKSPDFSAFYTTISDLQSKILHAVSVNSSIDLNISKARITTEDFRVKFKNELNIRQSVEADVASLRKLLDTLTLAGTDLDMNIKELRTDLDVLKNNHAEKLLVLQPQMTKEKVNVVVNAKPQADLFKGLDELRQQYEGVIEKNTGDAQLWFQSKTDTLNKGVTIHTESTGSHKTELTDLKRTLQNLEITLQSLLSQNASLKATLEDTEAHYSAILARYQTQITSEEEVLAQLRPELESKKQEYVILLAIKTRLELEITEYKSLLDREAGGSVTAKTTNSK